MWDQTGKKETKNKLWSKLRCRGLENILDIASELQKHRKDHTQLESGYYTERIGNIQSDFDKYFQYFALLELIETFTCFPFGEETDVDFLPLKIGSVLHLNSSELQHDIQLKARQFCLARNMGKCATSLKS